MMTEKIVIKVNLGVVLLFALLLLGVVATPAFFAWSMFANMEAGSIAGSDRVGVLDDLFRAIPDNIKPYAFLLIGVGGGIFAFMLLLPTLRSLTIIEEEKDGLRVLVRRNFLTQKKPVYCFVPKPEQSIAVNADQYKIYFSPPLQSEDGQEIKEVQAQKLYIPGRDEKIKRLQVYLSDSD